MNKPLPIIFTDLDGSLLDHDTYSFEPASEALAHIKTLGIPLIINSSKTFSEILNIQAELGICEPIISENGAAVHLPANSGGNVVWSCEALAQPRQRVLEVLTHLRGAYGYQFTGFADCDVKGIAALTGLSTGMAAMAAERCFSEPVLWQGDEESLAYFLQQLETRGFGVQQGGRFLSVTASNVDKGKAMRRLCDHYYEDKQRQTIAIGDSPNDQAMLDAADIAVLIKAKRSNSVTLSKPGKIIRTKEPGPAGWQLAMAELLAQFK